MAVLGPSQAGNRRTAIGNASEIRLQFVGVGRRLNESSQENRPAVTDSLYQPAAAGFPFDLHRLRPSGGTTEQTAEAAHQFQPTVAVDAQW